LNLLTCCLPFETNEIFRERIDLESQIGGNQHLLSFLNKQIENYKQESRQILTLEKELLQQQEEIQKISETVVNIPSQFFPSFLITFLFHNQSH